MHKALDFAIRIVGCLTFAACSTLYAAEERWEFLITGSDGVQVYYDKQVFNSSRESVGTWIRNATKDGGYALHGIGVECTGSITIYHQRVYASDGRLLASSDPSPPLATVTVPASEQEKLRDTLCAKRPAWQRVLSR